MPLFETHTCDEDRLPTPHGGGSSVRGGHKLSHSNSGTVFTALGEYLLNIPTTICLASSIPTSSLSSDGLSSKHVRHPQQHPAAGISPVHVSQSTKFSKSVLIWGRSVEDQLPMLPSSAVLGTTSAFACCTPGAFPGSCSGFAWSPFDGLTWEPWMYEVAWLGSKSPLN